MREPSHENFELKSYPHLAPGDSPFRIKGNALAGFENYVVELAKAPVEVIAGRIPDPAIRSYVCQRPVASGWYDFLPFLHFIDASAARLGTSVTQLCAQHAAWQVRHDATAVHRVMMKVLSIDTLVARVNQLFSRYYDLATLEVAAVEPGSMVTVISALPLLLV